MSEVKFTPVSPGLVGHCWDIARPMIGRACEFSNGKFDTDSVRAELVSGAQVLWILYRGDDEMLVALTTSVLNYPRKRVLNIPFCGSNGNDSYWYRHRDLIVPKLIDWADRHHCSGIEVSGRGGWERVLSPFGFRKSFVTLELEI